MNKYYANHFIYELERASEKIEMLAAINLKETIMSQKDQFFI